MSANTAEVSSDAPDLEHMRLAVLNSMKKQGTDSSTTEESGKPSDSQVKDSVAPISAPSTANGKQLKEAVLDLRKLGLSFVDIQTQSKSDPRFLAAVFRLLDLPHPKIASPSPSPAPPAATMVAAPTASVMASSHYREKPNPLIRKSAPAEDSHRQTYVKRTKFGDDRWSKHLTIDLSDESDGDADALDGQRASSAPMSRAATPLEAKMQEIKRISQLLQKMEAEKRSKGGQSQEDKVLVSNLNTALDTLTHEQHHQHREEQKELQKTKPKEENPEIRSLETTLGSSLTSLQAVRDENYKIVQKLEEHKNLDREIEEMKLQLKAKMSQKVQNDIENVELTTGLEQGMQKEESLESQVLDIRKRIETARREAILAARAKINSTRMSTPVQQNETSNENSKVIEDLTPEINQSRDFPLSVSSSGEEKSENIDRNTTNKTESGIQDVSDSQRVSSESNSLPQDEPNCSLQNELQQEMQNSETDKVKGPESQTETNEEINLPAIDSDFEVNESDANETKDFPISQPEQPSLVDGDSERYSRSVSPSIANKSSPIQFKKSFMDMKMV